MKATTTTCLLLVSSFLIAGCGGSVDVSGSDASGDEPAATAQSSVASKPEAAFDGASPGKPSAPITMTYEIVGNPIVGAPVRINIDVRSAEGPVTVYYSINDTSALMFQEGQVQRWEIRDPEAANFQQLSVVPQREGRLYVNVSAEVMTPNGSMIRSMAIPLKVGTAPETASPNGEVVEGPDGEQVISLPARETN
jgi:hypothetical protein